MQWFTRFTCKILLHVTKEIDHALLCAVSYYMYGYMYKTITYFFMLKKVLVWFRFDYTNTELTNPSIQPVAYRSRDPQTWWQHGRGELQKLAVVSKISTWSASMWQMIHNNQSFINSNILHLFLQKKSCICLALRNPWRKAACVTFYETDVSCPICHMPCPCQISWRKDYVFPEVLYCSKAVVDGKLK